MEMLVEDRKKKSVGLRIIAPIIVVSIILAFLLLYGLAALVGLITVINPFVAIGIIIIGLVVLGGPLIYVLYERYKELKEGQEDDLDQY